MKCSPWSYSPVQQHPAPMAVFINIEMSSTELREIYKSVRNDPSVSDATKLALANALLDI